MTLSDAVAQPRIGRPAKGTVGVAEIGPLRTLRSGGLLISKLVNRLADPADQLAAKR